MRVGLILTGQMEFLGLPVALGRLFPAHTFEAIPYLEAAGQRAAEPFNGFTSGAAGALLEYVHGDPPSNLDKLIVELALATYRYDLVVLLDDLELANIDRPGDVVEAVRRATTRFLDSLGGRERRSMTLALQKRASLHLAVPMAEVWFFGDHNALVLAGVPRDDRGAFVHPPQVRGGCDLEDFLVVEHDYLHDDGARCTALHEFNKRKRRGQEMKVVPWLKEGRERHPKHYLEYLCLDETCRRLCSTYRETTSGVQALLATPFERLMRQPNQFKYLRSFLNDLACALEGGPRFEGGEAPLTSVQALPDDPLLRNL